MPYYKIGEKRSKFVLFAYLILALIGSSAISAGEAFYMEHALDKAIEKRYEEALLLS